MIASAPGKIVLLGEYAVFGGGPALVAAIDRRAMGRIVSRDAEPSSQLVDAVFFEAVRDGVARNFGLAIETHGFSDPSGRKYGLGSSSATAVVASALALRTRDARAFELALRAHRASSSPDGSGIDIAASWHGGVIATSLQPAPIRRMPSSIPGLHLALVFVGESASTPEMITRCRAAKSWAVWTSKLSDAASRGIEAWERQDGARFVAAVREYATDLDALGNDAGAPIVTERIEEIVRRTEEAHGAAKPSGAGGGDIVVMWSRDPDVPHRIADATRSTLLHVAIDPVGLAVDDE